MAPSRYFKLPHYRPPRGFATNTGDRGRGEAAKTSNTKDTKEAKDTKSPTDYPSWRVQPDIFVSFASLVSFVSTVL